MCIRDRLNSLAHRSAAYDAPIHYAVDLETGEVRELAAVPALGPDSQFVFLGASREALFGSYFDEQGAQQFASISRQDLWEGSANWQAVSYTHLDVYKRQQRHGDRGGRRKGAVSAL